MMASARRVHKTSDGRGYTLVQVLEDEGEHDRLLWQVKLEQYRSIRLAEMISPERFVVVCEKKVRFFEGEQELAAFATEDTSGAVIDAERRLLHVLWRYGDVLESFSLDTLQRARQLETGGLEYVDHLRIGPDGRFLSYFMKARARRHGYHRIDPRSGKVETFELPYPPSKDFDRKKPTHAGNLGVTACWEVLGDLVFKVMFFDLTTFELKAVVPVRTFEPREINVFERDVEREVKALRGDERDKVHDDAVAHFIGNLNTIAPAGDGAFWLCWRGGFLRKVWPDGRVSAMLRASTAPNLTGEEGMPFFHCHLREVAADHLIINVHSDLYRVPLAGLDLEREGTIRFDLEPVAPRAIKPRKKARAEVKKKPARSRA